MKEKIYLIVICWFLLSQSTWCQNGNIDFSYFNKYYNPAPDTTNLLTNAIKPIDDGYLIVGGYASLNDNAIYLTKLDLQGNEIWRIIIDNSSNVGNIVMSQQFTKVSDGNFVLTYSQIASPIQLDIKLVKFTKAGEILWNRTLGNSAMEVINQVIETADGGFALTGGYNIQGGIAHYYVIKTDTSGNFEWDKTYMLDNSSVAFSIQETPWDGGFIIGGYAYNTASGTGNYDAWVIKTDHLGDTLWTRTYGSLTETDCACFVIPLTTMQEYFFEGKPIEYLFSGCTTISEKNFMHLAKLDEYGNIFWEKKYESLGGYGLTSIQTTPIIIRSSNVLENRSFIGACSSRISGSWQNRIIKFYFTGTIAWHKTITCDPEADVYLKDMQPTPDGGYVLAGYKYSPSPQKGWVLKIDAQGNTCSPVGCDSTLFVSAIGAVADLQETALPQLVQISPNPVRDGGELTLSHRLPAEFPVAEFTLYDQSGKAVWEHEFNTWDRTKFLQLPPGLPAGLYLWQVSYMGDVAGSGKIVISD